MISLKSQEIQPECGLLSNDEKYTVFAAGGLVIRFSAPINLVKYVKVKHWDHGYIVVDTMYKGQTSVEEEYIDLIPILDNLMIDSEKFLKPIQEVKVFYE